MDVIITVVGEDPNQMIAEVSEDDQDSISTTGVSTDTEEEEAMEEDGDDDDNFSEGTKY